MTDQQPNEQDRAADTYADQPEEQASPVDAGDEQETAVDAAAAEGEDDAPADESAEQ